MGLYEITLGKEDMKFSSAHFTVFDTAVERLHGHNYQVLVTLKARRLAGGLLLDFGLVKREARRLCAELDEALLVPGACRDVQVERHDGEVELRCRGKRYVLPADDCRILPVANVSCECLAEYFCHALLAGLGPQLGAAGVVSLGATVVESPGQSGRCEEALGGPP